MHFLHNTQYKVIPKNKMVEEHYPNLGFKTVSDAPTAQYVLDVETYQPRECYIKMKDEK